MKELKRIMIMIAIVCMMLCIGTVVNAEDLTQIAISEGTKSGNVVTFTITLPDGAGFRGDATDDGVVNTMDSAIINNYISNIIDSTKLNVLNADFDLDGTVNSVDFVAINKELLNGYSVIALTGTLADDTNTSYKVSRNTNGTYKVDVNLPEGKEGTIGIKVNESTIIFTDRSVNKSIVQSKLVSVENKQENQGGTDNNPVSTSKNITISNGIKELNKVTFGINLPNGIGLRGDANNDGRITQEDVDLITNHINKVIDSTKLNILNADASLDGTISSEDIVTINKELLNGYSVITLNGTLAEKSTYELIRSQDGKYSVIVTVPSNENGTIGVTLNKRAVVFADHSSNDNPIIGKLLEISDAKENNNVTSTDNTQAKTELPKAGYKATILVIIASIIVLGTLGYIRYKNIDK